MPTCGQGLLLCRHICDFLHRNLRRIVQGICLPDECDWNALQLFEFAVGDLLSIPDFMQKLNFERRH